MAALSNDTLFSAQLGTCPMLDITEEIGVAASTTIYNGAIVAKNVDGYIVPASNDPSLIVIGRAENAANNANGSGGEVSVKVRRGVFKVKNSSGEDAITGVDLFLECYAVDDQTVARTDASGTRPVAGLVVAVEADGVWVEFGGNRTHPGDLYLEAAEDLSAKQYHFITVDGDGKAELADAAGEQCIGVLQNNPKSGKIARIRTFGKTRVISSGTINEGTPIATNASGQAAAAALGVVDTSDAGVSTDPVIGSYTMGIALTAGAAGQQMTMLLTHSGLVATTAA